MSATKKRKRNDTKKHPSSSLFVVPPPPPEAQLLQLACPAGGQRHHRLERAQAAGRALGAVVLPPRLQAPHDAVLVDDHAVLGGACFIIESSFSSRCCCVREESGLLSVPSTCESGMVSAHQQFLKRERFAIVGAQRAHQKTPRPRTRKTKQAHAPNAELTRAS